MISSVPRFTTTQLNELFVNNLKGATEIIGDISDKPLLINISIPFTVKLRVYLFNCTNPPGGRASNEYKSQIIVPGQVRGYRGNFDFSDNRIVIFGAYAQLTVEKDSGVFVFWDPMCHIDFAYSANVQVKSDILIRAFAETVVIGKKNNGETIISCKPENLIQGIETRITTF